MEKTENQEWIYTKEYWTGDSRDGTIVNGDGYHYFKMLASGLIQEAYEMYENDDGQEIVTPLPEMMNVNWILDLGFEDFEALDKVSASEFIRIQKLYQESDR